MSALRHGPDKIPSLWSPWSHIPPSLLPPRFVQVSPSGTFHQSCLGGNDGCRGRGGCSRGSCCLWREGCSWRPKALRCGYGSPIPSRYTGRYFLHCSLRIPSRPGLIKSPQTPHWAHWERQATCWSPASLVRSHLLALLRASKPASCPSLFESELPFPISSPSSSLWPHQLVMCLNDGQRVVPLS